MLIYLIAGVVIGLVVNRLFLREADDLPLPKTQRMPTSAKSGLKSAGSEQDIANLARAGQKIQAIKLYRELYGVGLKEAKEAVEALTEA